MYRQMGEEQIHTDLIMGQYGIVAIHGGMIKSSTFDAIRLYTGRKLKKGNCFAFYRVDAPYKVNLNNYFRLHACLSFRLYVRTSHFHFF